MLIKANKAINGLQKHIESMMKVSAKYGKKMGIMGTVPFNSARGAGFARETAEMMQRRPEAAGAMMDRIFNKAGEAGMSGDHMKRMEEVATRIHSDLGSMPKGSTGPLSLKWL
jgi:hypothetical protein